jgi:endogenous inhibitor of DNA gyrase (YacG/DUF329 family)
MAIVNCPTCQKSLEWSPANPWRPFCCERCKLIDLGEWASGERAIAGPPLSDSDMIDEDLWTGQANATDTQTRH